jgi:CheY-like chemotaxis protein
MRTVANFPKTSTTSTVEAVRVLLVDDDPNFRALVRALLPAHAEVVGEVGDGDEAWRSQRTSSRTSR